MTRVRDRLPRPNQHRVTTVANYLFAGIAGAIGSYAVAGFTPDFVASPIAAFTTQVLPGSVVTLAILVLGDLGQRLNLLTAIGIAIGGFATAAAIGAGLGRWLRWPAGGVLAGGFCTLLAYALTPAPVAALGAGAGAGTVIAAGKRVAARRSGQRAPESLDRRRMLGALAALVGVGVIGSIVERTTGTSDSTGDPPIGSDDAFDGTGRLLREASERSLDVDGLEPLVSDEFYEVDIATVNPSPSAVDWSLSLTGAVDGEATFDYEDLRSYDPEHRFVTLRCVGERLNGQKMDNALWTGIPAVRLLEHVTPRSGCECVMLRAADGYYEEFPLAALQRGFLAFGMNGDFLPRRHGYPVRALIPGHWGEINVKWLTEIEFLDEETDGYWEQRGWHGTGPVNTVAKLHAVDRLGDGRVAVGGHAYAGLRGISAVEVSIDDGDSWAEATLSEPLPGEDVWRQWTHTLDIDGETEVVVRAIEADGTLQPEERADAFPSGPTGWVTRSISP